MKTKSFKTQGNHTDRKFTIYFTGVCHFTMFCGHHIVASFILNPISDDTISPEKVAHNGKMYYEYDCSWFMYAKLKYTIELNPIVDKENFDADIEWKE